MDKKRKTIGLVFTSNENWVGGLYYILNIIKAIALLPKNKQPQIILLYDNNTPSELLHEVNFDFIKPINLYQINIVKRLFFSLLFRVLHRNYIFNYQVKKHSIDLLYPFNNYHKDLEFVPCEIYYWLFDFQHKFLPNLFSPNEITKRDNDFELIANNAKHIVVSSNNAKNHFYKYFPYSTAKLRVLQFASIIDNNKLTPFDSLKEKYSISKPYFLVSNQFWQHKNHIIILKALNELKKQNKDVLVLFTGKDYDPRNPGYVVGLKKYINENNLNNYIRFLGFISRNDQLGLMKNCTAVIQPSKFEGWGTVVEDAKTLGAPVILSDIEIHREQIPYGEFFGEDDFTQLAEIIEIHLSAHRENKKTELSDNGRDYYLSFAENILSIL